MQWHVEFTDEFEEWWDCLTEEEQDSIDVAVGVLGNKGPMLTEPLSKVIQSSRHYPDMKELRVTSTSSHLRRNKRQIMARSFEELRAKMSPERRARNEVGTQKILRLYDLRQARRLSQEQIAELLNIKQSTVSKMERNTDILISTLRRYLEAMGGKLIIKVQFADGEVEINQFHDLDEVENEGELTTD